MQSFIWVFHLKVAVIDHPWLKYCESFFILKIENEGYEKIIQWVISAGYGGIYVKCDMVHTSQTGNTFCESLDII